MTRTQPKAAVRQNGLAIREIRQREGLTVTELATAIGVSDPHMRNIESENRAARPEMIARIALKLRCRPGAISREAVDIQAVAV